MDMNKDEFLGKLFLKTTETFLFQKPQGQLYSVMSTLMIQTLSARSLDRSLEAPSPRIAPRAPPPPSHTHRRDDGAQQPLSGVRLCGTRRGGTRSAQRWGRGRGRGCRPAARSPCARLAAAPETMAARAVFQAQAAAVPALWLRSVSRVGRAERPVTSGRASGEPRFR